MGTSQSSNGSPSGVPMVPPWVPDIAPPASPNDGAHPDVPPGQEHPAKPVPVAPARRFLGANRNLGDHARTGDKGSMRRGVGQYVKKGYGGSETATRCVFRST